MKRSFLIASAVAAALVPLGASDARAAIVGSLTYTGPSTVNVGDVITARISLSTDNPNGIAGVSPRIQTSLSSINGTADTTPFEAALIPTSGAAGSSTALTVFNPALTALNGGGSFVVLGKQTATFVTNGTTGFLEPNSTNTNRPITGFTGQGSDGRAAPQFFSANNATQTYFADVSFRATQPANNVFFGLLFSTDGSEYTSATLSDTTANAVTPTVSAAATGFSVKINPVPEPTSVVLVGLGALGALARRRRI